MIGPAWEAQFANKEQVQTVLLDTLYKSVTPHQLQLLAAELLLHQSRVALAVAVEVLGVVQNVRAAIFKESISCIN